MLATLQPGASYHIETFDTPRYGKLFGRRIRPETLDAASLDGVKVLLVPCRTNPLRLSRHWPVMRDFLCGGGTLVAMGETFQNEWIPGVSFHPEETNYWWWLEKGADLGVETVARDHPLLAGIGKADVTWHLHGWYDLPPHARTLVADRDGKALMYEDVRSFGGRLIVTSLDPCYHHGSHFMPATTRFLDRFLPNLAELARAD
ncbi:MAG: hypothetical protein JNL71_16700 [Rhodospirillales bacterium]|nr:hypothetical protein [Rhodospirillales bacterium]